MKKPWAKPKKPAAKKPPLDLTVVKKPLDPAMAKALGILGAKMVDAHVPTVVLKAVDEAPYQHFKVVVGGDWFGNTVIYASADTWSWQGASGIADYYRALVLGTELEDA